MPLKTANFIMCPPALLQAPEAHVKLWLAIKSFCHSKESCFPGLRALSKVTGWTERHILRIIPQMEKNGLLVREKRQGRRGILKPVCPSGPMTEMSLVTELSVVTKPSPPHDRNVTTPMTFSESKTPETQAQPNPLRTEVEEDSRGTKEEEDLRTTHDKNVTGPKKKIAQTREDVEVAIVGLDLPKFIKHYPALDIPAEHESFRDYYLSGMDIKTGKPNWKRWSNWNDAFHTWCRNAIKYGRASPKNRQPSDHRWKEHLRHDS